jgi:hypothetical protein
MIRTSALAPPRASARPDRVAQAGEWLRAGLILVVGTTLSFVAFVALRSYQIERTMAARVQEDRTADRLTEIAALLEDVRTVDSHYPQGNDVDLSPELADDMVHQNDLDVPGTDTPIRYTKAPVGDPGLPAYPYTLVAPTAFPPGSLATLHTRDGTECQSWCSYLGYDSLHGIFGLTRLDDAE